MLKNYIDRRNEFFFKIGKFCFSFGIFLLPSAFFYSSIFLLISFIIANIKSLNLLKDKWNFPLIICSFLMIIVCLITNFDPITYSNFRSDKISSWVGLLNWIPFFWVYWCAQLYLKTAKERIKCAFFLVLGTIPILISGFGQYYFNWYGPFKLFNETIVWYQREPICTGSCVELKKVLTGPFNNPNYAGTWLTAIFPFSIFFFEKTKKICLKKFFFIFITISITIAIFLTKSRNAITNFSIASTLLIGLSIKTIFLIFLIFLVFISSIFVFEIPLGSISFLNENKILSSFIPDTNKISDIFSFPRIKIWKTAFFNILSHPFTGWGASSFSFVYLIKNGEPTYQHTHNLILEVTHNYGIIISFILFTTIFLLIFKSKPNFSKQKINYPESPTINKFWWVSTLIILLTQLTDITYYDGRISLIFWILISGLRSILKEKKLNI